jgi:hypothetical protein
MSLLYIYNILYSGKATTLGCQQDIHQITSTVKQKKRKKEKKEYTGQK